MSLTKVTCILELLPFLFNAFLRKIVDVQNLKVILGFRIVLPLALPPTLRLLESFRLGVAFRLQHFADFDDPGVHFLF